MHGTLQEKKYKQSKEYKAIKLESNLGTAHINSISSTVYGDRDMPSHRAHTVPHKYAIYTKT